MKFDDAQLVESICYSLRQNSWPRSRNRALINQVFNGFAPFTELEVQENGIEANYNDLTATRKAHDARGQMYSAILKPGNYFRAVADIGPKHKRADHSRTVTRNANRLLKRSMGYYELQRAKIAQAVLHGVAPSVWPDGERWRPKSASIEDVLVPSGEASELPMENLPLFAIHKSLTAPELIKLTRGPKVDKAWNMPVVEACLEWIDRETEQLMTNNWPLLWSQEKRVERVKEGSWYGGDTVPTIEVYDFYWWDQTQGKSGWKRRMLLDPWGTPEATALKYSPPRKKGSLYESKNKKVQGQFLFNPGDRIYATNKSELISFQFADLSAVAPFRYHNIRGLGWLLHDMCQVQNRLTCRITEATFETLTMLFRVKSMEDVQRVLKSNLFNRGLVDENLQFIPASERWQVNTSLVDFGYNKNREMIDQGSSSMSQNQDMSKGVEKGQLQIMAELNATTSMLSAGLLQYYQYQEYEYREIFRRLLNKKSSTSDGEVNEFRARCLAQGVPENMLSTPEGWDIDPERVLGAGNKTMAMAMAQQLLSMRPMYDPPAQRTILRSATTEITDDPALAQELVPAEPGVSDTVHDTELVFDSLMNGRPITPKDGLNAVEAAGVTLNHMEHAIGEIMQSGGVGTPLDVKGLTLAAGYASHFIQQLEQDKETKQIATALNGKLGKLGNLIKGMQQRQQEQMQKAAQQNGGGGLDPKDAAKIKATEAAGQQKIKQMSQASAQRTAQAEIKFQQQLKQDQQRHQQELHKSVLEHGAELHKKDLEGAANIRRGGMKSFE